MIPNPFELNIHGPYQASHIQLGQVRTKGKDREKIRLELSPCRWQRDGMYQKRRHIPLQEVAYALKCTHIVLWTKLYSQVL